MSVISIQSKEQFAELSKNNKIVVVDFTASWCGPCKQVKPVFAQLAKEHSKEGVVVFVSVDVDDQDDLAQEWKVEAMPTFVVIKDGEEAKRQQGASPQFF
mmetsp:Transcript_16568/g.36120  ORF Transcript_16568/g.36120 Transcript_16568/m.36120 type:complete len:100 (+) Transcript_16568:64-363(+)